VSDRDGVASTVRRIAASDDTRTGVFEARRRRRVNRPLPST
jgi:hypothetical protein